MINIVMSFQDRPIRLGELEASFEIIDAICLVAK